MSSSSSKGETNIRAVASKMRVKITSTIDLVHAIMASQSVLLMREGQIDYDIG